MVKRPKPASSLLAEFRKWSRAGILGTLILSVPLSLSAAGERAKPAVARDIVASPAKAAQPRLPPSPPSELSVVVDTATAATRFTFSIPTAGCVAICGQSKTKRGTDRLWGPFWYEPGTHVATLPTDLVTGRKGILELFTVSLAPVSVIGRAGKGERQFIRPMGIGWDATAKELYVADTGNDRIVRLSADGRFVSQYGGFGVAFGDDSEEREDSLDEPWDVAPGGFSNFYVSDQNNNRICEFDAYKNYRGTTYPKDGDRASRLDRPRGVMVDGENNLWVVDSRGDRVLKLTSSGNKLFELGGFGWSSQKFKDPTQVAVDDSGRLFVCDRGNGRIGVFDRLGSYLNDIRTGLKSPTGVAVDSDGLVLVCDESSNQVCLFLAGGKLLAGIPGVSDKDRFRYPADLVATPDAVYVLDSGNNRIVVLERRKVRQETYWQVGIPMLQ